jgi:hypothetical protein
MQEGWEERGITKWTPLRREASIPEPTVAPFPARRRSLRQQRTVREKDLSGRWREAVKRVGPAIHFSCSIGDMVIQMRHAFRTSHFFFNQLI